MAKKKNITVLDKFRPLKEEELSTELTPEAKLKDDNYLAGAKKYNEEFASEASPLPRKIIPFRTREGNVETVNEKGSVLALTGLVFSVLSLFFIGYILAPIGMAFGYIGYRRGSHALSIWAMGLGVVGLIGAFIATTIR